MEFEWDEAKNEAIDLSTADPVTVGEHDPDGARVRRSGKQHPLHAAVGQRNVRRDACAPAALGSVSTAIAVIAFVRLRMSPPPECVRSPRPGNPKQPIDGVS